MKIFKAIQNVWSMAKVKLGFAYSNVVVPHSEPDHLDAANDLAKNNEISLPLENTQESSHLLSTVYVVTNDDLPNIIAHNTVDRDGSLIANSDDVHASTSNNVHVSTTEATKDNILKIMTPPSGFHAIDVPMDGNCFYHSIADQLNRRGLDNIDANYVRQQALQEIRNNRADYEPFIAAGDGEENINNFVSFIIAHARDGYWADHLMIKAVANAFSVDVEIYTHEGVHNIVRTDGTNQHDTIKVFYQVFPNGGAHYTPLIKNNYYVRAVTGEEYDNSVLENIRKQDEFRLDVTKKKTGNAPGYFAIDNTNGNGVLFKVAHKNAQHTEDDNIDRQDFLNEVIAGPMFEYLLKGNVAETFLIAPDAEHQNLVYLGSKIIPNSTTLLAYLHSHHAVRNVNNFETLIALSHVLGDGDVHPLNMMVDDNNTSYRIDYGKAMTQTFENIQDFLHKNYERFVISNYIEDDHNIINFNIHRYNDTLHHLLAKFDIEHANHIIDNKINELEALGFNPVGLVFDNADNTQHIAINTFEELTNYYKNFILRHYNNMQNIAREIDDIAHFTNASEEFINGQWLPELVYDMHEASVFEYALNHHYSITGSLGEDGSMYF